MQSGRYIVSLSLGTVAEPSAVVVIEPRTEFWRQPDQNRRRDHENHFDAIWLERFPAGRPIPAVVARVSELMSGKRLAKRGHLLLDISSTGAAPVRVFESHGLYPDLAVDLTNTGSEKPTGGVRRVPLRDVIGVAQVVLQTARLKVARDLALAETLVTDLMAFDPKPVARNMDLRGGRNADLVFAVAVALWWADDLTWGDDAADRAPPVRHSGPGGWMAM